MSIEPHSIPGYSRGNPYRVTIHGVLALDKKGNPRKFKSMMEALEWGQRYLQKKEREKHK